MTRPGCRTTLKACRSNPAWSRWSPPSRVRAGATARGVGRPRRRGRRAGMARIPGGPRDRDQRSRLAPRRRLGPVPAGDLRDPGVRGLRVRSQHVQPRRSRGAHGDHRVRVLPGRAGGADHAAGRAAPRGRPDAGRDDPVGDLLRRGRPGRHLAAVHGDPHRAGRCRGPHHRSRGRCRRLGAGAAVLRRHALVPRPSC